MSAPEVHADMREFGPFSGDVRGLPEAETLRLRTSEPFLARLLERARGAVATASRSPTPGSPKVRGAPTV